MRAVVALVLLALACGGGDEVDLRGVVRDGRTGAPLEGARVRAGEANTTTDEDGEFRLPVKAGEVTVRADAPGVCANSVTVAVGESGAQTTLHAFPAFELETQHAQVGFDTEHEIRARARCDRGARLRWEQVGGPALGERLRVSEGGHRVIVHTHALTERVALRDRVEVLSFDRAERTEYRLRVRGEVGGQRVDELVRVTAAPTSAGIYQVPSGADLYVNGGERDEQRWALLEVPERSEAELEVLLGGRVVRFRPDRFGTYLLSHPPSGTTMSIQAGAYGSVPHDCGRTGCHREEDRGWAETAHATTFREGIEGRLGDDFEERCWSCHATGVDWGIDNGGLHHTAARRSWTQPEPGPGHWEQMPRQVRRDASVWCSNCHGPGRIVPPQFHWQYGAKLKVGVCARCHDVDPEDADANHRSPHVDEWRQAAMATLTEEGSPATRRECAGCHSAQGFVHWRRHGSLEDFEPDPGTVEALTCATCHDPHQAAHPRGLRVFDQTDPIGGHEVRGFGAGAVCATCHRSTEGAPHAPQTEMLLGLGARGARGRQHAHAGLPNGCAQCHMARPDEGDPRFGRVGGHTYAVRTEAGFNEAACATCHEGEVEALGARDLDGDGEAGSLREEMNAALTALRRRLREKLRALGVEACGEVAVDVVEHDARLALAGEDGGALSCDGAEVPRPLRDAAYDLLLLERDGSFGRHNPEYAAAIVAALRRSLR